MCLYKISNCDRNIYFFIHFDKTAKTPLKNIVVIVAFVETVQTLTNNFTNIITPYVLMYASTIISNLVFFLTSCFEPQVSSTCLTLKEPHNSTRKSPLSLKRGNWFTLDTFHWKKITLCIKGPCKQFWSKVFYFVGKRSLGMES